MTTTTTLDVRGARLAVDEVGDGVPLVLVHGTGADATTWTPVLDALAAHHRVVAYDRRGYGRSRHRPVRDHRVHARDLRAVLDHVGEPAHVLGWSSGGTVALAAAIADPAPVRSLVVVEAPFHGLRWITRSGLTAVAMAKLQQVQGRPRDGAEMFFRWAAGLRGGGSAWDELSPAAQAPLLAHARTVLAELDPHPYGNLGEHLRTRDVVAIPRPLTWLLGGRSMRWYGDLASHVRRARPDTALVTVPGASHLAHVDAPDAFVEAVLAATGRA